jgi:hypothetical protein
LSPLAFRCLRFLLPVLLSSLPSHFLIFLLSLSAVRYPSGPLVTVLGDGPGRTTATAAREHYRGHCFQQQLQQQYDGSRRICNRGGCSFAFYPSGCRGQEQHPQQQTFFSSLFVRPLFHRRISRPKGPLLFPSSPSSPGHRCRCQRWCGGSSCGSCRSGGLPFGPPQPLAALIRGSFIRGSFVQHALGLGAFFLFFIGRKQQQPGSLGLPELLVGLLFFIVCFCWDFFRHQQCFRQRSSRPWVSSLPLQHGQQHQCFCKHWPCW